MSRRVVRDALRAATTVAVMVAIVLFGGSVMVAAAGASEGTPLGITEAKLQTTRTVEREVVLKSGSAERAIEEVPTTYTQAGGHLDGQGGGADGLTFTLQFTSEQIEYKEAKTTEETPTRDPKDILLTVPTGLLANPTAVPQCNLKHLLATHEHCPADTQIGIFRIHRLDALEEIAPVVNVTPETGQSLEWAIELPTGIIFLETAHLVRTSHGYGFTIVSENIPEGAAMQSVEQTVWGVPADPSHDPERGLICVRPANDYTGSFCQENQKTLAGGAGGFEKSDVAPVAFLTMPTSCTSGPESATVRVDSWEEPGHVGTNQEYEGFVEKTVEKPLPTVVGGTSHGFTGCDALRFDPSLEVQPDPALADEPIGLGMKIDVPQPEQPETLGTPHLRNATITLPLGMSVSPGVVDGIQACNESGPEGINMTGRLSERVAASGELQLAPGDCPDASTIGTAEAVTPLLPEPVKGHVYLARPRCGDPTPCTAADALDGNLYRLYLELGGSGALGNTGIEIKLEGQADVNPATGQITAKFLENPQTPFSELIVHLNPGPRASLASPAACGSAVTTSDFSPWSAPGYVEGLFVAGTPDATPQSEFEVTGCAPSTPFAPGFVAGTVTPQAGQFSAFTMNISRNDREQYVKGVQVHTPPGLTGILASVPLCAEPQADAGTCPRSSKIGTTRVATGAGSHPFEIEGSIYLTTGYGGAPFGLSVVTDAVAGPFNLGLVVVRARIDVDPSTSALTVTTDETGPYALPQILDGVPLRLKRITVNVDRPGFMINPTDCGALAVSASISGSQDAVANVSSPFAVGGCKSLVFKPSFKVSTNGHTSRANGASLDAKVSYPKGALGNDANIARVKVDLPKQLPSRLTTLQKACTAAQFSADPAGCPAASIVGIAKANTPLLPVGLAGPVYFVSNGGEAFPSLIVVLQGDGVRVDLTGATFISKAGITSSTFKTIPDVPVNTFELYLPQGRYSALAANGNLCRATSTVALKRKVTRHVHGRVVQRTVVTHKSVPGLVMPTEFVAQNGAVFRQSTKIAVSGCTTAKTAKLARGRRGK